MVALVTTGLVMALAGCDTPPAFQVSEPSVRIGTVGGAPALRIGDRVRVTSNGIQLL